MTSGGSGLLLLVEDQVQLCDLLAEALEEAGFDVAVARDGSAAIVLLQRYCREVAALITDIDLGPPIDGWSVAVAARALQPRLPVVYMSGASAADWPTKGVADSTMLGKPFVPDRLTAAVKASLRPDAGA